MTEELSDIKYIFNEVGFEILAAAAGIDELMCFVQDDTTPTSEVMYKRELLALAQRGIIEVEDERILVLKPFSDIFRTIANRNKIIKITSNNETVFFYLTDRLDAVEASAGRKKGDYIVMGYISCQVIKDRIRDILPDNAIPEDILFMKPETEILKGGEEVLESIVYDRNNNEMSNLKIKSDGIYFYVTDTEGSWLYKKDEFLDRMFC